MFCLETNYESSLGKKNKGILNNFMKVKHNGIIRKFSSRAYKMFFFQSIDMFLIFHVRKFLDNLECAFYAIKLLFS